MRKNVWGQVHEFKSLNENASDSIQCMLLYALAHPTAVSHFSSSNVAAEFSHTTTLPPISKH